MISVQLSTRLTAQTYLDQEGQLQSRTDETAKIQAHALQIQNHGSNVQYQCDIPAYVYMV